MANTVHDHEILIGSDIFKGILARDSNGKALYSVIEVPSEYNPNLVYEQTNWINGHGRYWATDPGAYFEGQSIDTTQDGRIILAPLITEVRATAGAELDSAPVCFFWSALTSKWLCATTGKVYYYNGTLWTEVTTANLSGVVNFAEFDGYIFASRGTTAAYAYSSDALTWTTSTLADPKANHFFTSPNPAGTAMVLYKSGTLAGTDTQINELKSNTDGKNGGVAWGSAAYIGDTRANISNIFLINDNLMIGKTDNLYNYDSSGGVHPLMDDIKTSISTRNFQYVINWQSAAYFSRGNSLGELTSYNTFNPMGVLEDTIDIDKNGFCTGLTADTKAMYVAMNEGTDIHIYKGTEIRNADGLSWRWCPYVFLGTNACTTIGVCQHTASDKRLWFGYGTHTGYVNLLDNPTADSSARFCPTGWVRMSYTMGTNLYSDKVFTRLITDTKGCSATKTISTYYRKDTDTVETNLTPSITTNGVVQTDFYSAVPCKKIQFEVHLTTDDSTATPELLMFRAVGTERPEAIRIHEATYVIGDDPAHRSKTLRTALRAARDSVALVRFADLNFNETISGSSGTDFAYVMCQPGYPQEVPLEGERGRQPEVGMKVRWEEVGNTIVDDWGYYYNLTEDIFQDIHDSVNHALNFTAV